MRGDCGATYRSAGSGAGARAGAHARRQHAAHAQYSLRSCWLPTNFSPDLTPKKSMLKDLIGVTGGPANLDLAKFAIRAIEQTSAMDERARRELAAASGGHASPGTHQSLVSGRRESAAEYLLPDRAAAWESACATTRSSKTCSSKMAGLKQCVEDKGHEGREREMVRGARRGGRGRRIRSEYRMAEAALGRGGGQFHRSRNALQRWNGAGRLCSKQGAKAIGDPKGFHAIAVDARAPKFDGGIVTRLDAIPFGMVVNKLGAALLR